MTQAHRTQLWTLVGTVLLFYCLNSWVSIQGGNPILDVELISDGPSSVVALFGLVICAPSAIQLFSIGVSHARTAGRVPWPARLPTVFLNGLDPKSRETRAYQGLFFVAFVLIPIAALIHFLFELHEGRVWRVDDTSLDLSPWHLRWPDAFHWIDSPWRIGERPESGGEVSFFPGLQPYGLVFLVAWAFLRAAQLLHAVFRR